MIKILVIPSWYPPDGGYFFKEHSESIADEDIKVEVLYNRILGMRKLRLTRRKYLKGYSRETEDGIRVTRSWFLKIPGNERVNARRWIQSTFRLFKKYQAREGAPDVILAHSGIWAGCAAEKISNFFRIPFIITEHRSFMVQSTEESKSQLTDFYKRMLAGPYLKTNRLVAVSESMKPGLLQVEPRLEKQITIIPNMVNGDYFTPPKEERETSNFTFISVGRLVKFKGLDVLLRAFSTMNAPTEILIRLKIVGSGTERENLEILAEDLGITDRVEFTGRISRENVSSAYRDANCFILPSLYEAFGVVLIEAMSAGLPVIATRSGGPSNLVNDESGYMVEPADPDALRQAMEKMIRNYAAFKQADIRKITLEKYGKRDVAKQYHKIFRELLKE